MRVGSRFMFDISSYPILALVPRHPDGLFHSRQVNREARSKTRFAIYPNVAATLLHNPVYAGQAKTASLAIGFLHAEGLEDMLAGFGVNSRAGVQNGKQYIRAWPSAGVPMCEGFIQF